MPPKAEQAILRAALRARAEEIALGDREQAKNQYAALPATEAIQLIHELHVHQIELQMQNDELRKIQEELEISKAKYFDLYERAPIGYCTLDKDGNFLEANLAASDLLELPATTLIRQPFDRFVEREFQDTWYLLRKRLQAAEAARTAGIERNEIVELQMVGNKGTAVWVRLNAKVIMERDALVLVRIMISDISLVKKAEAENARLEKLHFEHQKLEALGSLAAGVAHDFNNLLAVLYGNIELAQTSITNATALVCLGEAMGSLETARGLTRQLLTFAKGGGPNPQPGRLFAFVRDFLERRTKDSNINCAFDIASGDAFIQFDQQQLRQVLDHLLQNAREAMPQGGTIRMSAQNTTLTENQRGKLAAGSYAAISITDSGTGISQPLLQRVFEPFFTTKQGHHGLGLTICFSILKRHKGTIEVESFEENGTTFHFLLPRNG
jgi:two-component system, cell cycle sensor histidine kinase and response regulator CckA